MTAQPPVLTLRFDFTGNLRPCRFSSGLAMTSDCPECKHPLAEHGPYPDKVCRTCDGIANLVLIDRRAQCNNTVEVVGEMPENYRVKAVQCSKACSEHHTFMPGCAQFILHSGSLGVDDDTKIQTIDEAVQAGRYFTMGPIVGNFDEFRAQYIPPTVHTYEYWEGDRNAMAQADSYATWEPPTKALHEAANILETAPYSRVRMAEWLRQMARRRDMLDAMGEGADQQGLEKPEDQSDASSGLTPDDRISQLQEQLYDLVRKWSDRTNKLENQFSGVSGALAGMGSRVQSQDDRITAVEHRLNQVEADSIQVQTEGDHRAKELYRLRDKIEQKIGPDLNKARDTARLAHAGLKSLAEDSDQNIIQVRRELQQYKTQAEAQFKMMAGQLNDREEVETHCCPSDRRVSDIEVRLAQLDRALSRQYSQKGEMEASLRLTISQLGQRVEEIATRVSSLDDELSGD